MQWRLATLFYSKTTIEPCVVVLGITSRLINLTLSSGPGSSKPICPLPRLFLFLLFKGGICPQLWSFQPQSIDFFHLHSQRILDSRHHIHHASLTIIVRLLRVVLPQLDPSSHKMSDSRAARRARPLHYGPPCRPRPVSSLAYLSHYAKAGISRLERVRAFPLPF